METLQTTAGVKQSLLSFFKKEKTKKRKEPRLIINKQFNNNQLRPSEQQFLKQISQLSYPSDELKNAFLKNITLAIEDGRIPLSVLKTKWKHFLQWNNRLVQAKPWTFVYLKPKQKVNTSPTGFYPLLKAFLDGAKVLPQNEAVWHFILKSLVYQSPQLLSKLMKTRGLNDLTPRQLNAALDLKVNQFITLAQFILLAQKLEQEDIRVGFSFIQRSEATKEGGLQLARSLRTFICDILPLLAEKLGKNLDKARIYGSSEGQEAWLNVWMGYVGGPFAWRRHRNYHEQFSVLAKQSIGFNTLIQYIPAYIWWHLGAGVFEAKLVKHLGEGKNMRTYDNCGWMSRKMVHIFCNLSPTEIAPNRALSYAFVQSLGLNKEMSHLVTNYLPQGGLVHFHFETVKRWKPVLLKLADWQQMEQNTFHWQRLLGYIQHCIDEFPEWSIKGRTFVSLNRMAIAWHVENQNIRQRGYPKVLYTWEGANYKEWNGVVGKKEYQIVQLLSSSQLVDESQNMDHCVHSYDHDCKRGLCSIWSLREKMVMKATEIDDESKFSLIEMWRPKVTIEVNANNEIVQMKAAFNAQPEQYLLDIVGQWAVGEQLEIADW